MPYGLASAPRIFQSMINKILRDFLQKCVIAYLDNILIYSPDLETHKKQVRLVLQRRLWQHNLYVKAEKCKFHKTKISFLGYITDTSGVSMDQKKIDAVLNWPTPQTIKDKGSWDLQTSTVGLSEITAS